MSGTVITAADMIWRAVRSWLSIFGDEIRARVPDGRGHRYRQHPADLGVGRLKVTAKRNDDGVAIPHPRLLLQGRITPEKGPDVAIRWAKAAGLPLRIAAKIPRGENRYFREHLSPHLDGGAIQFVGEVDERGKQDLLGKAAALLFPIDWPEPFGLVMIEAMACGTPVIARPRGSVPEIIEHGVSGFLVESDLDVAEAISQLSALDRRRVRDAFERQFTVRRMAEQYLTIYRRLAGGMHAPVVIQVDDSARSTQVLADRTVGELPSFGYGSDRKMSLPPNRAR